MFSGDEPKIGIVSAARRAERRAVRIPAHGGILPQLRRWAFVRRKQISAVVIFVAAALPVCRLLLHINGLCRRNAFCGGIFNRRGGLSKGLHRRLRKDSA